MRRTAVNSLALLLTLAGPAVAQDRIMVRATAVLPDSVGQELMKVGQPVTISIPPNVSVEEELQAHCGGSVSNQYRAEFTRLNPGSSLLPAAVSRDLLFPACARVQRMGKTELALSPGDTSASFLDRELGAKPETRLLICQPDSADGKPGACRAEPAQDIIAFHIGRVDGKLEQVDPPLVKLWLPFRSSWTVILPADGITAEQALDRLKAAAKTSLVGADLLHAELAPPMALMEPLSMGSPTIVDGPCSPSAPTPPNWPYDRAEVRRAIDAALAYISTKPDRAGQVTLSVVRVADTGVSHLDLADPAQGFPLAFLAVNPKAKPGELDRNTGFQGAYYGIDAEGGGDVRPRTTDPNGWHGTQVADLALGGVALRGEYADLSKLLHLNVARIFSDQTGHVWVDQGSLNTSLTYGPPYADIVNFSVGGPKPLPPFGSELMRGFERRQLVVVAAGNEGEDLGLEAMYPPSYMSDDNIRNSMIVVGAHSPAAPGGKPALAAFSNRGKNYVDLLAPGCKLSPAFDDVNGGVLAGTSFAAPLVSFTAGLVRDFLFQPQAREIKERLWATVRQASDEIQQTTRFGGVLDVPAALRVFDDVARQRDGKLIPGRWLASVRFQPCSDFPAMPPRLLMRVWVKPKENQPPSLELLWRDAGGLIEESVCTAINDEGPRMRLESGADRVLHWSELEAFIPAFDADDRRIAIGQAGGPADTAPAASPAPAPIDTGNRPSEQVARIQAALRSLGETVAADGIAGPATRAAVRNFQRTLYEAPTGTLTERQLDTLFSRAVPPAAAGN